MATANDLYAALQAFEASALVLDPDSSYTLTLWTDGEGELINGEWVQVTRWDNFDEGVQKLQELTALNEEAAKHG